MSISATIHVFPKYIIIHNQKKQYFTLCMREIQYSVVEDFNIYHYEYGTEEACLQNFLEIMKRMLHNF